MKLLPDLKLTDSGNSICLQAGQQAMEGVLAAMWQLLHQLVVLSQHGANEQDKSTQMASIATI